MIRYGIVWHGMAHNGMVWCRMAWCAPCCLNDLVQFVTLCTVWYGVGYAKALNGTKLSTVYGTAQGTLLYCMVTIWYIVVAYDIILRFYAGQAMDL